MSVNTAHTNVYDNKYPWERFNLLILPAMPLNKETKPKSFFTQMQQLWFRVSLFCTAKLKTVELSVFDMKLKYILGE